MRISKVERNDLEARPIVEIKISKNAEIRRLDKTLNPQNVPVLKNVLMNYKDAFIDFLKARPYLVTISGTNTNVKIEYFISARPILNDNRIQIISVEIAGRKLSDEELQEFISDRKASLKP